MGRFLRGHVVFRWPLWHEFWLHLFRTFERRNHCPRARSKNMSNAIRPLFFCCSYKSNKPFSGSRHLATPHPLPPMQSSHCPWAYSIWSDTNFCFFVFFCFVSLWVIYLFIFLFFLSLCFLFLFVCFFLFLGGGGGREGGGWGGAVTQWEPL